MKNRIIFVFLLITLAACTPVAGPAETPAQPTLSALLAAGMTADALTQAARFPSPPPTVAIVTPSPLPTQPVIPVITPDAVQVERWKEYEDELAKSLGFLPHEALCEWDILGTSEQVLYIWVVCESIIPFGTTNTGAKYSSSSTPALIHIEEDSSVHSVEIPAPGISDYQRMFPTYVQEKFEFYRFGRAKELSNHIEWRRTHPEEPPLIVLLATSSP